MAKLEDLSCVVLSRAKIKPRPEFDPLPDFFNALKNSITTFGVFLSTKTTTYEIFHFAMGYLSGLARAIECTLWAMSWASTGPCNMELCARTQLELEGYLVKIKDLAKRVLELIENRKEISKKLDEVMKEGNKKEEERLFEEDRRIVEEFEKLDKDMWSLASEIERRLGPILSDLIIEGRYTPGQAPNASSQENGTESQ